MTDKAAREARFGGGRPPENLPGTAGGSSGAVTRQDDFAFSGRSLWQGRKEETGILLRHSSFVFRIPEEWGSFHTGRGSPGSTPRGSAGKMPIAVSYRKSLKQIKTVAEQPKISHFPPFRPGGDPPASAGVCSLRKSAIDHSAAHRRLAFLKNMFGGDVLPLDALCLAVFFANIRSSRKRLFPGKTPRKNECFSKKAGRKKGSPGNFDSLCPFFDVK